MLVYEVYEGADAAVVYHVPAVADEDEVVVLDGFRADLDGIGSNHATNNTPNNTQ